jgi:DhnA family fructose-bisphosphate aldolase class Ia
VLLAGGPKTPNDLETLRMVQGAMTSGARGAFYGRNVWQHKNPAGMVRALRRVIHDNADAEDAVLELSR